MFSERTLACLPPPYCGVARDFHRTRLWAPAVLLAMAATLCVARAATVELRISVVNPLEREQSKEVRSNLPAGITVDDIVDVDGMELRYDVAQDRYYVYRLVDLAPLQRRDFRVVMRDIWVLPQNDLAAVRQQAAHLEELLKNSAFGDAARVLAGDIRETVDEVIQEQERYAIASGARAADHIRAYHVNQHALADARDRLGELENLALGVGLDPGRLLGTLSHGPRPSMEDESAEPAEYGEAVMLIVVRNTSPDRPRTLDLRRDLPREVRPRDVLDAGGLEVGVDPARGGTVYVSRDGLELEPGATRTFQVRLRDRWNIHAPRIHALEAATAALLESVRAMRDYPSVESFLEEVIVEIAVLRDEELPSEVNDRYVAFSRERGERLDELERKVGRVEASLRLGEREQRLGFDVKPPDPKTTWLIIYVILGFLGVISLLFFLRWYGKDRH